MKKGEGSGASRSGLSVCPWCFHLRIGHMGWARKDLPGGLWGPGYGSGWRGWAWGPAASATGLPAPPTADLQCRCVLHGHYVRLVGPGLPHLSELCLQLAQGSLSLPRGSQLQVSNRGGRGRGRWEGTPPADLEAGCGDVMLEAARESGKPSSADYLSFPSSAFSPEPRARSDPPAGVLHGWGMTLGSAILLSRLEDGVRVAGTLATVPHAMGTQKRGLQRNDVPPLVGQPKVNLYTHTHPAPSFHTHTHTSPCQFTHTHTAPVSSPGYWGDAPQPSISGASQIADTDRAPSVCQALRPVAILRLRTWVLILTPFLTGAGAHSHFPGVTPFERGGGGGRTVTLRLGSGLQNLGLPWIPCLHFQGPEFNPWS